MAYRATSQKSLLFLLILAVTEGHLQAANIDWQICHSKSDGTVFPNKGDCTSYVHCVRQTPVTLSCPTDMGFSTTARVCVNKIDSDCIEFAINETSHIPSNNEGYSMARDSTCDNNEKRPENQIACAGQDFGAKVPYPGNCSQFLVCMCEYPTVMVCPAGLWFDNTIKVCNYPQAVDCAESIGTTTTPPEEPTTEPSGWGKDCVAPLGITADICLKYDNGFLLKYPYNCNAYINCTMGCPVMNYCQADKVFNSFLKICDTPDTAQCEELPLPTTTTTEEPTTSTTEEPTTSPGDCIPLAGLESIICADQSQDSYVPYPYNCTGYIICKWECPYLEYCENGKIFNSLLGICDTPEGVICEELPLPTTTPTNPTTTEETTTTDVSTAIPTALPPDVNPDLCGHQQDNTIYPYEGDCSKYLQCQNGEVKVRSCPNGWLFNSHLMLCDEATADVCYTGTTTTEVTTTVTDESTTAATTPQAPGFKLCIGQPENTTFAYPEDCSWYYFCRGNDLYYLLPCPRNNYYDPYSGNCGPSESPMACKEPITTTTTVTTTLSPSEKCAGQLAGTSFPYEPNCQQYIFCNGKGGYLLINCPNGNYYYPDSEDCGPSDNPKICLIATTTTAATTTKATTTTFPTHTTIPQTTAITTTAKPALGICGHSSNGQLIEYPGNCQKYVSCVLPIPIAFYCNNDWYFNIDQQKCVLDTNGSCTGLPSNSTTVQPPNDICQGLSEGDWQIYATDCQLYYKCLGDGYYMLEICSEGQYFNPLQGQCSSQVGPEYCKQNVDTTLAPATTVAPSKPTGLCAQNTLGAKIAYPDNCFKYIVCDTPIPVGYNCPTDLQFSLERQACVEAIDSDCGIITITTTATTPAPKPTEAYSLCVDKPNFSTLPYKEDCGMFIICCNKSEHLAYCKPGQYFDVLQGNCSAESGKDACRVSETTTTAGSLTTIREETTTTEAVTTTTTQDPNLGPCYNKPDGTKLSYPNNCEKYIECRDPLPVGYDCPAGLEFSAILRECVKPEVADCSIKTTTTPNTSTETTVTATILETTSPKTEETCDNKPNGSTLTYLADCSKYYMCLNGNARLTNCMPNTYYDPSSGMCDNDVSPTVCQNTSGTTTTTMTESTTISSEKTTDASTDLTNTPPETEEPCSGKTNGYTYSYEKDCSKYYMCMSGSPILVKCPTNTNYNPLTGECDNQISHTACRDVEATTKAETATTTTTEQSLTTTVKPQSDNICCSQKSGTKLPYPGDSTKYVICQYPVPQVEQCPDNGNYDPINASCPTVKGPTTYPQPDCTQLSYGKVMTYEGDCSKYYLCFGSDSMVLQCSANWYFSPILNQCVPKDLYKCPW